MLKKIIIDDNVKQFFRRVFLIFFGIPLIPLMWIIGIIFAGDEVGYKWKDWIESWKYSWKNEININL